MYQESGYNVACFDTDIERGVPLRKVALPS